MTDQTQAGHLGHGVQAGYHIVLSEYHLILMMTTIMNLLASLVSSYFTLYI
jgi:hypothetical protein